MTNVSGVAIHATDKASVGDEAASDAATYLYDGIVLVT
jgi:hypothetical protein